MSEGSTTPDLTEIVHRSVEAMNRRELDTLMSLFAGDCVWDLSPMGLGTYRSRSAIRAFLEAWIGSYEWFELALEEVVGLARGVAFAVVVQRGRPVEGAGELDMRYASVNSGVDGLFERITNYTDIDEARAAAERLAKDRDSCCRTANGLRSRQSALGVSRRSLPGSRENFASMA
jgi:ketosteroid isomerase-like protein